MSDRRAGSNGRRATSGASPNGRSASAPMYRASAMRARLTCIEASVAPVAQLEDGRLGGDELGLRRLAGTVSGHRGRHRQIRLGDLVA